VTAATRDCLLDVSRLIWRSWRGALPTGIDRVCVEYLRHFAPSSLAVIQFRGAIFVLRAKASERLFQLLAGGNGVSRVQLAAAIARGIATARSAPPEPGMLYLDVGHTGLDDPALPQWVAKTGVRAVYLVHDLIPITHPKFCRAGEAARHSARMKNALVSASGIIANSRATLDELADFAKATGLAMPAALAAWISGPGLPPHVLPKQLERPYFATVGTIEGRKNHILLLQVWRKLVARLGDGAPLLLIIGQRGWEAGAATAVLDELGELEGHVRELGSCGDGELANLVAGAKALLMPSFAEGFGLPVIEALALGAPVIASDLPVYREIVGEIPTYLDPADTAAWEKAIEGYAGDGSERCRQIKAMKGYSPPDWPGHFAAVEPWLRTIVAPL
jgi:glycosyltransferase involved in cell wall biosynthesis